MILEEAFAKNPSPNAQIRDHLSEKVDMTGRSVQIWFQNRRAKEKKTRGGPSGDSSSTQSGSTSGSIGTLTTAPSAAVSGGTKAPMGSFAAQFQQLQPSFTPSLPQTHFEPGGNPFVMTSPSLSTISPASLAPHLNFQGRPQRNLILRPPVMHF